MGEPRGRSRKTPTPLPAPRLRLAAAARERKKLIRDISRQRALRPLNYRSRGLTVNPRCGAVAPHPVSDQLAKMA